MKLKYIITLLFLFTVSSFAQEFITDITWNMAFQNSKLKEYISDNSFKGVGLEGRRFLEKNISVGLKFGWNIFDQRVDKPIEIDGENYGGTISGTQVRHINSFPLMANIHYYYGKRRNFRLFAGLNTGMYYIVQRLDLGVWRLESSNWHFGLAPEVGFLIPFGGGDSQLIVTGRYNYAFDAGTSLGGKEDNYYSYWGINIGFAFSNLL